MMLGFCLLTVFIEDHFRRFSATTIRTTERAGYRLIMAADTKCRHLSSNKYRVAVTKTRRDKGKGTAGKRMAGRGS
jgi:hypothetical protein